jgi:hypothetical protein
MASSETLSSLLFRGRDAALSGDSSSALTLVLGNEAADLDSVVCAVGLAALLQSQGCAAAAVVGVPRADLRLRPELGWLLQRLALDEKMLLCADELDVRAAAAQQTLRVALVGASAPLPSLVALLTGTLQTTTVWHARTRRCWLALWLRSWTIMTTTASTQPRTETSPRSAPAPPLWCVPATASARVRRRLDVGLSQTERILAALPALLNDSALCTLLLSAILLDTGNLTGASVRAASHHVLRLCP